MIKMARKYGVEKYGPTRYNIVTAKESFHGRSYGSMSATGQPDNGCQIGFKPMVPGFTYAEFNDLEAFKNAVTEDTIAIMVEPVQGEGGVHPATQEFMSGLRRLCDEKGMLLLLDEVQTGWCRTGAVMSYMNYGIKPDIVSMAKAMGGGMPIGAICASAEVAKAFTPGSHGTTFGGSPVSCAASLAEIGELLDGYGLWETFAWIPKECVFPGSSEDTVCLYRIWQRAGQFTSMEYYAEAQEVPVLDEREDAVLVEDLYLSYYETLVCETSQPLSNGQTVIWLNPEG